MKPLKRNTINIAVHEATKAIPLLIFDLFVCFV